jgi:hypothetical protein
MKTDEIQLANTNDFKLPSLIDEYFSKYFQKFIHSFRNKEHPTININNLLILSGPEKNGKSWFLRDNFKKFALKESEKKPLVIHYDIRAINGSNFTSFLFNFENSIIESIVERNKIQMIENNLPLITVKELKELLFYRWEPGWLEINLSKSIRGALNWPNESSYTFNLSKISAEQRDFLVDLLDQYERKPFKQYVFIENFEKIIEIINSSMELGTDIKACLLLIQNSLIQREDLRKDQEIFQHELYRDGLEVMEYFFDVLNHIAGYHEKQLKVWEISKDDPPVFPHVLLGLESVQELFNMKCSEDRPRNYLHRIMLRLYNNSGYRNHFPIVIETNKTHYFDRTIYHELWEFKYTFPTLIYTPSQYYNQIEIILDKTFNNFQKHYLTHFIGNSGVYFYKLFLEQLKANDPTKFTNLEIMLEKEIKRFLFKINKFYLNPHMSSSLDKGLIDHEFFDAMKQWRHIYNVFSNAWIGIRRKLYDNQFIQLPLTRALLEEGILFEHKYHKRVAMEHYIYFKFLLILFRSLKNEQIKTSFWKPFYFQYYNVVEAYRFNSNWYTIGNKKSIGFYDKLGWEWEANEWIHGINLKWDVPDELYKGSHNIKFYSPEWGVMKNVY